MSQILMMVVNEQQDDWDSQYPNIEFAYKFSVSVSTGLALNGVRTTRLPHLSLTVFEHSNGFGHQTILIATSSPTTTSTVPVSGTLTRFFTKFVLAVTRLKGRNSALAGALLPNLGVCIQ